jgi:hypothetical protein
MQKGQKRNNTRNAIVIKGDESDLAQGLENQRPNKTRKLLKKAIKELYNQFMDTLYDSNNK